MIGDLRPAIGEFEYVNLEMELSFVAFSFATARKKRNAAERLLYMGMALVHAVTILNK